ncbi:three-Cys-motif partner protein TcmP [Pseudanabaena sp. FACHB-1277]|uniref:Three-Cys-motif partner protein TcmP n=1 Tax=Pseudanabaena cinerea FACHB-1277 TaxID=2949581 RepID=A0A926URM8_9CYAN|nr:three-Cys-motif partner protein TcmP [Pseudanabaena cinerea]MBD2148765.1 three-Cys-motif partner protein TcmP [Pseudanabaena cinerea FACHB-1277]
MSKLLWSADGSHIPTIDPHTKAKHLIIEKYVEDLICTLYGKGRRGVDTFTFIDGFSGGGIYKDDESENKEWLGSPVRLIKAVQEGFKKAKREYPINVKFIFIDDKQDHIDCLKNYVMPKSGLDELSQPKDCEFNYEFICGEFEKNINYCVFTAEQRKGHSFFLLDPQGWTDVSMQSIRKITDMKKSEILYTFMIDYIIRFIAGREDSLKRGFEDVLEADGYYQEARNSKLTSSSVQLYLRQESMRLFREKGKAKYVFSFAAVPKGDTRVLYYLLHLSKNLTALEVMKDSFWEENTLGYEYFFNVYGFGFRTVDYYERNQMRLKFEKSKDQECIELLDRDLGRILESHPDGITFREASEKTMELNPARKSHYEQYIRQLREDQLIEIVREGKVINSKSPDLRRKDIIRKSRARQLILPF